MKKISFNSPVILGFCLACLVALGLGALTGGRTTARLFSVYRSPLSPLALVRAFGHVLGHSGFAHLSGNLMLLLVIGPPMEEKYGSRALLLAIALTALVSGLFQCLFFPGSALLGASGVVFMLILLSSLAGMKDGKIPLTLILVALLYLGQEVWATVTVRDNISQFTHIIGGLCGTAFGFWAGGRHKG